MLYYIGFYIVGYFEERVVIRIVNPIAEFLMPKEWIKEGETIANYKARARSCKKAEEAARKKVEEIKRLKNSKNKNKQL